MYKRQETDRRTVRHRGRDKGNDGGATPCRTSVENETAAEIPGKLAAGKDENPVATRRTGESVRIRPEPVAGADVLCLSLIHIFGVLAGIFIL